MTAERDDGRALVDALAGTSRDPDALYALILAHIDRAQWDQLALHAEQFIAAVSPDDLERTLLACSAVAKAFAETGPALAGHYERIRSHFAALIDTAAGNRDLLGRLTPGILHTIFSANDRESAEQWLRLRFRGAKGVTLPAIISPAANLAAWSEQNRATFREIESPHNVVIANGAYTRRYVTDAFTVAVIPDGEILCGWDFVRSVTGEVLLGSGALPALSPHTTWFPHMGAKRLDKMIHLWPEDVQYIDADVLFLHGAEGFHIGHWIVDFLPRLRALKHLDLADIKVGIPRELPRKNRDLLALCGIGGHQLVECGLGTRIRFRQVVAVRAGNPVQPSRANMQFLSGGLRSRTAAAPCGRRTFLIRNMPTRQIVNMSELKQLLDLFGFDYMDLAHASVAEQQVQLGQTEIAICTYGSDPLATLFMPPGADLIEFNYEVGEEGDPNAGPMDSAAGAMTTLVDVNYHVLLCAKDAKNPGRRKDFDFRVDCREMKRLLDAIIDRQEAGQRHPSPFKVEVGSGAATTM